jgi:hypothetical protein
VDHDLEMTDGNTINPILESRGGRAEIAEKAWTAGAAWLNAEVPGVETKTAAGMDPALNAATYFENLNRSAFHKI